MYIGSKNYRKNFGDFVTCYLQAVLWAFWARVTNRIFLLPFCYLILLPL